MYKTLLFIGAIAFAAANDCQDGKCGSNALAEEDSNMMAERACMKVSPSRCAACAGAAAKRARRWRQIVAWRNNYQRGINRWYHAYMRKRAAQLRYWGSTRYAWIRKQYYNRLRYKNRVVASWVRTMNWRYNNCR